jgi:hypothetical protein
VAYLCPSQFEKELSRCIKLLEELDAVVARKKGVSQQVRQGMRKQAGRRPLTSPLGLDQDWHGACLDRHGVG